VDVLGERSGELARVPAVLRKFLPALLLASCTLFLGSAHARSNDPAPAVLGEPVAMSRLPIEAQRTSSLIRRGGPFPFDKDGVVFGNRERRLERRPYGFYHEYTVPTPGSRDRGARRIVCGGRVPTEPEACFYTEDHYASFHLILNP
jgi:ribonuclease T1